MEFQKIVNLLDTTSDDKDLPRFVTKKWIELYDKSGEENYNNNKEIIITTPMRRSDLCDFSDSYAAVEGTITVAKKIFVANNFVDFAENRRAAAATNSNTANEAAICFEKLAF